MAQENPEKRSTTKAAAMDDKVDEAEKMEVGEARASFEMPSKSRPALDATDVPDSALPDKREEEQEWRPADEAAKEHPKLQSLPDGYEGKTPGTGNIKGNAQ